MVNIICEEAYTISYDHRLKKYYEKGFAIGLLRFDLSKFDQTIKLGKCKFGNCENIGNKIIIESFNVSSKDTDEILGNPLYESINISGTNTNKFIENTISHIENMNKNGEIINYKMLYEPDQLNNVFYIDLFKGNISIFANYDYRSNTVIKDVDWYGKFGIGYTAKNNVYAFNNDDIDDNDIDDNDITVINDTN